ncbi:MAG: efflux RND transporter periplasmic adaptor subunit [Candidatus Krumholzibacteriia bacterium]
MHRTAGRTRWLALGAVLAGVLVIVLAVGASRRRGAARGVPTTRVQRGPLRIDVTTVGELQAVHSSRIPVPRLKSSAVKLISLVPEGTTVAAGDTLARFDTTEALRRIEELDSRLVSARANLEKLRATQAAHRAEMNATLEDQTAAMRLAELNAANVSYEARVEQEKAELTLKRARLNLQQLESRRKAQRAIDEAELTEQRVTIAGLENQVRSEREALANHVLVAPAAGLVVHGMRWASGRRVKINVGDLLYYGIVVIELPDLSQMRVGSHVNEARVNRLQMGQVCEVRVDAFPDTLYPGRVTRINVLGRELRDSPGVKVFDFEVTLEGHEPRLRPGMTATVVVQVGQLNDVIFAPIETVHSDDDGFFVYRRNARGYERVSVTLGRQNEFHVVLNSGVSPGDEIALHAPVEESDGR